MKQNLFYVAFAFVMAGSFASCEKAVVSGSSPSLLTDEEKSLVASAGFNSNWVEKSATGEYLIEGDIYLTKGQLESLAGKTPTHNFIVGDEEHYRTFNVVSPRNITVSIGAGFPSYYYTALDKAIARYNSNGLTISFSKVSSGGAIHITAANLGTSGGGCILGRAAGFPDASGNPSPGFTLSNSSCATTYINTEERADEVIAHEMGHCIGFRHTDYKKRASCGPGPGETAGSIGAVHIPNTPTNVSGSYDSWMMACTNGKSNFNSGDVIALKEVY